MSKDYDGRLRQIVVTGTGRQQPMLISTNDFDTPAKEIIKSVKSGTGLKLRVPISPE